ncbi:MAG: uracil phosphoribosyltransferase [Candidatus Brocadiae bacterium]|nr:uracil phosphoribosyltransferase [Candidatus Brocadiia bacterium]
MKRGEAGGIARDVAHVLPAGPPAELRHRYGRDVHLVSTPWAMSLLARLCSPDVRQPVLGRLVRALYGDLLAQAVSAEFPRREVDLVSRMAATSPAGRYRATVIDPATRAVCVNIARAGTIPSETCFDALLDLLDPEQVRQDHVFMNRKTDRRGRVTGVTFSGSKIGGPLDGATVLIPDPMGATGSSMIETVRHLVSRGKPAKILALHLIVTPEYIAALRRARLPVRVWAVRLDRGLSQAGVLRSVPGAQPRGERGLTGVQYVVPGAGGVGELLNNSEL